MTFPNILLGDKRVAEHIDDEGWTSVSEGAQGPSMENEGRKEAMAKGRASDEHGQVMECCGTDWAV